VPCFRIFLAIYNYMYFICYFVMFQLTVTSDMELGYTLLFVVILTTFGICSSDRVRYDGHKVLQITPKVSQNVQKIANLEHEYDLDFWHFPKHVDDSFHVRVNPQVYAEFLTVLEQLGTDVKVMINDVQHLIDLETRHRRARAANIPLSTSGFDFNTYYDYPTIVSFLNETHRNAPDTVKTTFKSIGRTYEGRDIYVITIEDREPSIQIRPDIFIDGGIHAREWVSPATVLYFVNQLVNNPEAASLLKTFNWHIVPVLNPDGYQHSHSGDRLWRKNRNPVRRCVGVDLNRNFAHMWDPKIGGSTNPCSDVFSGDGPLSEAESFSLDQYLNGFNTSSSPSSMIAYLTIHSYGQMWLYPWGYTSALPADEPDLRNAANTACNALLSKYGTIYRIGSSTNVLYSAAGGSDDHAKGRYNIKYSYTLELRDQGYWGFQLPNSQILPTAMETWDGLVAFANYLKTEHCNNSNEECVWY